MSSANDPSHWDVVIVGGGPAGLSAALLLSRACRRVLLIDAGEPRNSVSNHTHGFFSRDGVPPGDLLAIGRKQLLLYPSTKHTADTVLECRSNPHALGFHISTAKGCQATCQAVLLAQGIKDVLPDIRGIEALYGRRVHHCPYCDGWEHHGKRLVVYGSTPQAAETAWELRGWSPSVTLITDPQHQVDDAHIHKLKRAGINLLHSRPVEAEEHPDGSCTLACEDGEILPFDALFFVTYELRPLTLLQMLGCKLNADYPDLSSDMQTSVSGVFVAGNICRGQDMIAVAVAQGTMAAIGINDYLLEQERFYRPENLDEIF